MGYLLARDGGPGAEAQFLESLADRTFTPVILRPEDHHRAAELVTTYRDLALATTDATVIALCERLEPAEVATIDRRHFSVVRPRHIEVLVLLPSERAPLGVYLGDNRTERPRTPTAQNTRKSVQDPA